VDRIGKRRRRRRQLIKNKEVAMKVERNGTVVQATETATTSAVADPDLPQRTQPPTQQPPQSHYLQPKPTPATARTTSIDRVDPHNKNNKIQQIYLCITKITAHNHRHHHLQSQLLSPIE